MFITLYKVPQWPPGGYRNSQIIIFVPYLILFHSVNLHFCHPAKIFVLVFIYFFLVKLFFESLLLLGFSSELNAIWCSNYLPITL